MTIIKKIKFATMLKLNNNILHNAKTLIFAILMLTFVAANGQGYQISVKVQEWKNCEQQLLLANHMGDKQYIKDSSTCKNGIFVFEGAKKLENGIYLIVMPKKNYVEIVVSEQEDQMNYYFEVDTNLTPANTKTQGSEENKLFFEFNEFSFQQATLAEPFGKILKDTNSTQEQKEEAQKALNDITKKVFATRQAMAEKQPSFFVSKVFKALKEDENVEAPASMPDSLKRAYVYHTLRSNYWKNVDMGENGLVRSPVFHNKLKMYFDKFMPPLPDTAIMMADKIISDFEKAGGTELYKYTVYYLLTYFQDQKYMCFDKAVYHIAQNYYCAGKAFWADSATVTRMCTEASRMGPTLCEKTAPDVVCPDSTFSRRISMHSIKAPITVLIFWDIDCGHCKKEIPAISKFYDSCNKAEVAIYAVYTRDDYAGWKKFIKEKDLKFINVANGFGEDKFRENYHILTTPQIFVLDEKKVIKFKKVGADNLPSIVEYMLKEKKGKQ